MTVDTTRFGTIEVDESSIIELPLGLLGFEKFKRYCLIQPNPDTPFKWLQSVDSPDLAFVVADPLQFYQDYEVEVSDPEVEYLGIEASEDAVVMTLVTISEENEITTNLLGPIVLNARTLTGMQVVLQNENYKTKHKIGVINDTQTQTEQLAKAA